LFVPNQLQNVPGNIRDMIRTVSKPNSIVGPDPQSPSINDTHQSDTSGAGIQQNENDNLPMLVAGPSDATESPVVRRLSFCIFFLYFSFEDANRMTKISDMTAGNLDIWKKLNLTTSPQSPQRDK